MHHLGSWQSITGKLFKVPIEIYSRTSLLSYYISCVYIFWRDIVTELKELKEVLELIKLVNKALPIAGKIQRFNTVRKLGRQRIGKEKSIMKG